MVKRGWLDLAWRHQSPGRAVLAWVWLSSIAHDMARTHVDIDEVCREVMRRYQLKLKRETINLALRTVATEPLALDEARKLHGSGWEGDVEELRSGRRK